MPDQAPWHLIPQELFDSAGRCNVFVTGGMKTALRAAIELKSSHAIELSDVPAEAPIAAKTRLRGF